MTPNVVEKLESLGRVKIKATFDKEPYRGFILKMGGRYISGIKKDIRTKIQKTLEIR